MFVIVSVVEIQSQILSKHDSVVVVIQYIVVILDNFFLFNRHLSSTGIYSGHCVLTLYALFVAIAELYIYILRFNTIDVGRSARRSLLPRQCILPFFTSSGIVVDTKMDFFPPIPVQ